MLPCWYDAWDPSDPPMDEVLAAGLFLPLQAWLYILPFIRLGREGEYLGGTKRFKDGFDGILPF